MKTFRISSFVLLLSTCTFFLMLSCNKEVSVGPDNTVPAGKNELKVMLTDDPSIVSDSLFIEIIRLEVKVDRTDGTEHWDTLPIHAGIYNILQLTNGVDTLLGIGYVPDGRIDKIRLTLGGQNRVVVNGVSYPLQLHNNQQQFEVSIDGDCDEIDQDHFRLWLDFDGHHSIVRVHGNQYELNPRIGHFSHDHSGEIEGKVQPMAAFPAVVAAISGTDTIIAVPDAHEGEFKIRGIQSGTVNILITSSNGYRDTLISNVPVDFGDDTEIGTIILHQ